ncbi:hypothetical protein ID866_6965 [Astraeus odoratus]|nr:hypothetical protein ID866_6965 [Astraeus odoratus]
MSSAPFTVIGTPYSTFTRTITLALHYKGLSFDQVSVLPHTDIAREHHPFGFIPTLVINEIDGKKANLKLAESIAIARYLDRVAPEPSLCISAGDGPAIVEEQLLEFVSFVAFYGFRAILKAVVKPRVALSDEGKLTDAEIRQEISEGVEHARKVLAVINQAMSPTGYVFGEKLSWADFFLYPILSDLQATPERELLSERLRTWMNLMEKLDVVKITTPGTLSLVDIANGLHYLHGHVSGPIFHGDLKGLNVLVSNDHRALLADFGFSELVDSSFDMTVELPWGGSLPWMAPERLEYADVSAASDVWAFGMTALHRALQVPFTQVLGSPSSPSLPRPRSQDHLSYVDITKTDVIDLRPLKNFTTAVSSIVELTTKQTKHEDIMSALLMKISEVYKFLLGADTISRLNKLPGCLAKISQQILECSRFMQQYAEIKSYWSRMKKDITNTTRETIIQYNRRLDRLMWTCYDDGVQDEHVDVYRVLEDITYAGEKKHLMDMAYAQGVGIDATKRCLKGTREEILVELVEWMNGPDKDVSRVFWLAGLAGQGKSTIAHTIASWFSDLGGIGACFCFSRDREADRLHEKLFSTIARDLADRHPSLKRVLVEVVSRNRSLKRSPDIMQQWRKLNLNPVLKLMSGAAERILIVIDALDECFAECSREYILPLLASDQVAKLPTNFRIIVTSRPLSDINNALRGVSHITVKTMEEIPSACVERDIRSYICDQLPTLVNVLNEEDIVRFVRMSDGLFEWARLACEFIKSHKGGLDLKQRYHEITSHATGGEDLLDTMYTIILKDVIETTPRALTRFRSVMQQVLWASEPLSIDSMNALRYMFSNAADRYNVDIILEVMAPLLSGIANRSVPIRALHTSFHDFLTNAHRSGEFFVPRADVHLDMAFASLQVLRHDLRFNICNLASSYVFNSDVLDMDQRISTHISRHLSYACRFWGTHLQETNFCELLAIEVKYFFDDVKVLLWLETLSLLNAIQHAVTILDSSCKWLAVSNTYCLRCPPLSLGLCRVMPASKIQLHVQGTL